jgi:uncharacterized cupin superfamily protein
MRRATASRRLAPCRKRKKVEVSALQTNSCLSAGDLSLELIGVPEEQSLGGDPQTGAVDLGVLGGVEVGVWEMTNGTMRDVEADEIFIVLSGQAVVEFDDGTAPLHLKAGDVGRFSAGTRTVWTVTERLRKVFLT